jgi:hypothetical protein
MISRAVLTRMLARAAASSFWSTSTLMNFTVGCFVLHHTQKCENADVSQIPSDTAGWYNSSSWPTPFLIFAVFLEH